MRVLIIDDSRAMRSIIKRGLAPMNCEVAEAADGRQALAVMAEQGPFDLALVDWNMPVMNGYEFVCAVRADPNHAGMKLMMVTTEVEMTQISRALDAGANEYLMKPFTEAALQEKIEMLAFA